MLLRTAKLFVHSKEVFLNQKLSPSDLAEMSNERLKELLPCDQKMDLMNYNHGLSAIQGFMSLSGKFQRFLQDVHGIGDDPVAAHAMLLKLLPSNNLELLRCYCLEHNRKITEFAGGEEAQVKITVILKQLEHFLGKKSDQKNVVDCALYFEEYLRRAIDNDVPTSLPNGVVTKKVQRRRVSQDAYVPGKEHTVDDSPKKQDGNDEATEFGSVAMKREFETDTDNETLTVTDEMDSQMLGNQARNGKNSTDGDENRNIMKEHTRLKLVLKRIKKEHSAVCNQRDELNDLLGKMMHKNVRLKVREDCLKDKNKQLKKKIQKRKKKKLAKKRNKMNA